MEKDLAIQQKKNLPHPAIRLRGETGKNFGGSGRIRTCAYEVQSLVPYQLGDPAEKVEPGSNRHPAVYKTAALALSYPGAKDG